jgi:hypothetical protein
VNALMGAASSTSYNISAKEKSVNLWVEDSGKIFSPYGLAVRIRPSLPIPMSLRMFSYHIEKLASGRVEASVPRRRALLKDAANASTLPEHSGVECDS